MEVISKKTEARLTGTPDHKVCVIFQVETQFLKRIIELYDFTQKLQTLTLILLTWTIWRAPTNASKWRMGFNPYPANVDNMASSYQC